MTEPRDTLKPLGSEDRVRRRRLSLRGEFLLALLPTATVLVVFALVEVLSRQRLLFASLASSAFLIYLDPGHATNTARTLVVSQLLAASVGLACYLLLGPGYLAGGTAMVVTIGLMIALDRMHPPAVSTSLGFAFRAGDESNLLIFALALAIIAVLVAMQRAAVWMLGRYRSRAVDGEQSA